MHCVEHQGLVGWRLAVGNEPLAEALDQRGTNAIVDTAHEPSLAQAVERLGVGSQRAGGDRVGAEGTREQRVAQCRLELVDAVNVATMRTWLEAHLGDVLRRNVVQHDADRVEAHGSVATVASVGMAHQATELQIE